MLAGTPISRPAVKKMLADLQNRFDHIVNVNSSEFDPTYVVATALDPRYKGALSDEQLSAAKACLLQQVRRVT